jgi:hypothetical protein
MSPFVSPPIWCTDEWHERPQSPPEPKLLRTYRVTGTWGTGDQHVIIGQLIERCGEKKLTMCVNDHPTDRSAITGTYLLEAV